MKIHAYTKRQLAQLYFPDVSPHVATNRLTRWMNRNPQLMEALQAAGYHTRDRCLTVRQVRIIVDFLGESD